MKRRGFTVIELLIVIIVIAILATIVVVMFRNVRQQAYLTRAEAELSSTAKAIQLFHTFERQWPGDVDRGNAPAGLTQYMNGSVDSWPTGPWPGSVYDYDSFNGSDGQLVVQISLRFCPIGGPLSACNFPTESWADGFQVNSSMYWCITGKCRPHPSESDTYPGYCLNCRND